MRSLAVLPLVIVLGCSNPTEDTSTPDTPSGSVPPEQALAAVTFPADWLVLTNFIVLAGDACPAITQSDTVTTLTGGCTDEDGQAWAGSAVISQAADADTYDFDAFGIDGQFVFDGEMRANSSGRLVVDGELDAAPFGTAWSYEDLTYSDSEGWLAASFMNGGASDVSGTLVFDDVTLTVSGSVSNAEDTSCSDEFDDGTVTLTGGEAPLVFTWSEAACDGCADYTHGDDSGTVCLD